MYELTFLTSYGIRSHDLSSSSFDTNHCRIRLYTPNFDFDLILAVI